MPDSIAPRAAAHVACELARQIESGVIVTILPDGGERYLSTPLFQVATPDQVVSKLSFFNTLSHRYELFEPIGKGRTTAPATPAAAAQRRQA